MISIIVPAYNSGPYIGRLLESIAKQNYKDLEVIISDDCSTEPYDDVVDRYRDRLRIVRTSTEYNCCPGNTRQAGVDAASGDWYTFADHDDEFCPGVFARVGSVIRKESPKVIVSDFVEVNPKTGKVLLKHDKAFGWTHGKFYSAEWWKAHGLRYRKDLKSHEDIYLSTLVDCALHADGISAYYLPMVTYRWMAHPESQSRSEKRLFIETHFSEYLQATGYAYLEDYEKRKDKVYSLYHACSVVLYAFFYQMGAAFRQPEGIITDNAVYARNYVKAVRDAFGMTNEEILSYCTREGGRYYWQVMTNAAIATGPYVPFLTLQQYLELLDEDES